MPWIKKNLTLVLGGLVGLVLLGGSGFFLFTQSSRESTVNTALEEKRTEWNRLNELKPYPDEKNIKAVREEAARVEKLSASLKQGLKAVDVQPVTDTFSLKLLIETTISELKKEAEAAGVHLPDRYAFTFQKLREMPQFDSNGIPKLAEQVAQISTLCRVLFDAKVHSLDQLRRPAILKDEGGSAEYLTKKAVTNKNLIVRAPYDLSFRAFSSELAGVLRGFAALDEVVAIKTVNIEPTTLPQSGGPAPTMIMPTQTSSSPMMPGAPGAGGMDAAMRARYGLGPAMPGRGESEGGGGAAGMDPAIRARYGLGPGGGSGEAAMRSRYGMGPGMGMGATPPPSLSAPVNPGTAAPAAPAGPSVVIDEKPLRVILQLDFVKPKPEPEAARRTARPAAGEAAPAPAADASATPPASP
ncbi:MAG: Amuc_1100 family pilus-like protein [Verrucomicrobiales bacterium]|nr:Amuc_1100 family pilus-like protein [Verrucomicrobiales bacterium]